jgi:carboxyl-terminal processing protease
VTGSPSAAIIAKSGLTAVFKQQRRSQVANPFNLTALFCPPLLVCCGLVASPQVRAEDMRESDRTLAYVMLRDLQKEIERVYYDPDFKGMDIAANAALAKSRISKSSSIGEAWSAIAQFALDMDDSHTLFVPPSQTVQVDYGWDMEMIGDACYIIRVREGSDAARQRVHPGDMVKEVNGLKPSRETLWRLEYIFKLLQPQPGLHVELVTPAGITRELDLAAQVHKRKKVMDLTGSDGGSDIARLIEEGEKQRKSIRPVGFELSDQIYIVRLPSFLAGRESVRQVLRSARGHEVLILDLRGNGGGDLETLKALVGYLEPGEVTIGSYQSRERRVPIAAKGAPQDVFSGRVFVLVDAQSASASELLARTIQLTNRGTVIGDRTAGAVMTARLSPLRVNHGENIILYGAEVTVGDVIMSDGARLEKVGVEPDFKTLPTADDLANNRDPALAQALKFAGHPLDSTTAGALTNSH